MKDKLLAIIQKIKDIFLTMKNTKPKAEHYLELWRREETQITFGRAKKKLGRICKAIRPRKWEVTGVVGLKEPAATGQMMGVLGALYPILGSRVRIMPEFEEERLEISGSFQGKIRLGTLCFQFLTFLLNKHCIAFIKLIFRELEQNKKAGEV